MKMNFENVCNSNQINETKEITIVPNVTNRIIIKSNVPDSDALKECIRQILYCSSLKPNGVNTGFFDPEKYREYLEDMDKDPGEYENDSVFKFDINNAKELREYFHITSTYSTDKIWIMFKEGLLSNTSPTQNYYGLNKLNDQFAINHYTVLAFRPWVANNVENIDIADYDILPSSHYIQSCYKSIFDGDKLCIHFGFDSKHNNGFEYVKELSLAYPELEFHLINYVQNLDVYSKLKYEKRHVKLDIDDIVCGCYIIKDGGVDKGITSNDIEIDEKTIYPRQFIWNSLISDAKFTRCLNPNCGAVYPAGYYSSKCYGCGTRKYGRVDFIGLHPIIEQEFPLICRLVCVNDPKHVKFIK